MTNFAFQYPNRQTLLKEWFAGKVTCRVPKVTDSFPGRLKERLLYGVLLDCVESGKIPSIAELSRLTGLDRGNGVRTAFRTLSPLLDDKGLPIRPAGDRLDMFRWYGDPTDRDWFRRVQYYRLVSPSETTPLTPTVNSMLFRLYDLLPMTKDKQLSLTNRNTKNGLATLLGAHPNTVRTGIAKLTESKLLQLYPMEGGHDFGYGVLRPTTDRLGYWLDRSQRKPSLDLSTLADHNPVDEPDEHDLSEREFYRVQCVKMLDEKNIPSRLWIVILGYLDQFGVKVFTRVVNEAIEDHEHNRKGNPKLPEHAGALIVANLKQYSGKK